MTQRIILNPSGLRVSKPGFDASVASDVNMGLYPNMDPMRPLLMSSATFSGGGSQDFSVPNPTAAIPYVVLRATDYVPANRGTYCAEMWEPYNIVRIRNISGVARTIYFTVLL